MGMNGGSRARSRLTRGVALVAASAAALSVGLTAGGQAEAATGHGSQAQIASRPSQSLADVSGSASDDVWAVGAAEPGPFSRLLAQRWNGTQWHTITVASPRNYGQFQAVHAVSSSDVWAGGSSRGGLGRDYGLVEHFDGTRWSVVRVPHVAGSEDGWAISGITGQSPDDIWIAGGGTTGFVDHYDGKKWTKFDIGGSAEPLTKITEVSATDVWATVNNTIEHFDGTTWTTVKTPDIGILSSIVAPATGDVWATASQTAGQTVKLLHLSDGHWATVNAAPVPGATQVQVNAVSSDSAGGLYLVGADAPNGGPFGREFVEHYDGTQWSLTTLGHGNTLYGVTALSPTDVWAVGYTHHVGQPERVHYNGTAWTRF
jgi:hypothetical protein